jgi:hypothetical protein
LERVIISARFANADVALRALSGDATALWLPDTGLLGNGHTMMAEYNNEKIADLIENWVLRHVPTPRGSYRK